MDYPKCKQPVRTAPWITYDKFAYQPGRHGFCITNTLTQTTKAMMTAIDLRNNAAAAENVKHFRNCRRHGYKRNIRLFR